jgi:hypothetical protein
MLRWLILDFHNSFCGGWNLRRSKGKGKGRTRDDCLRNERIKKNCCFVLTKEFLVGKESIVDCETIFMMHSPPGGQSQRCYFSKTLKNY